jgi:iron complex outermembrane receptor protein
VDAEIALDCLGFESKFRQTNIHFIIMRSSLIALVCAMFLFPSLCTFAQSTDSLRSKELSEVVVIGRFDFSQKKQKSLATLDSYLESNTHINMLKRGAYAWEPLLNGMATERSVITIDGMRIYGACTDKMDPVTSYVEISNLSRANIQSGQAGGAHGASIAGSIDLERAHARFDNSGFAGSVLSGWESNNQQKIVGTKLQFGGDNFFANADLTWRDAQNYKSGGGQNVAYSQFSKYNISGSLGWKLRGQQQIIASIIYDKASDVGYPALPMDVAKAEAGIYSLQYTQEHLSKYIHRWDTKLYYNQVTHIMDDSKRPIVPIRMDMPGWSKTWGFYSKLSGDYQNNLWKINLSAHYNQSLAEMTMYSNLPNHADMFMLTWPGVGTYATTLHLENKTTWNEQWSGTIYAGTSLHHNQIENDFGYQSLQIFYPNLGRNKSRWLKNIGYNLAFTQQQWTHQFGLSCADRAPSVSEGYGFYLFNSMDRYDYVGKPNLKNESAIQWSASSTWAFKQGILKAEANYFQMSHYIIGKVDGNLIPMTIGAQGIKRYEQIAHATIVNMGISLDYAISTSWRSTLKTRYRWGAAEGQALPQIQPLDYDWTIKYQNKTLSGELNVNGAAQQSRFAAAYGESPAPAYTVLNMAFAKQFSFQKQSFLIKTGIENLLDKNYRTFADWNNIPRMGRNYYLNLIYKF